MKDLENPVSLARELIFQMRQHYTQAGIERCALQPQSQRVTLVGNIKLVSTHSALFTTNVHFVRCSSVTPDEVETV